jgi:hypothetical protein
MTHDYVRIGPPAPTPCYGRRHLLALAVIACVADLGRRGGRFFLPGIPGSEDALAAVNQQRGG